MCRKARSVRVSDHFTFVSADGIFWRIRKNLWLQNFPNLKFDTRLPRKKIRKLDVDAFCEGGKRFKTQIHLIIISRDCWGATGSNMTCVHLLQQAKLKFKDSCIQPKYCLICCLYAPVFANAWRNFLWKDQSFISNFQFTCRKLSTFG